MNRWALITAAALSAGAALAQGVELFSPHVRILQAQGSFAQKLVRIQPPSGDAWREYGDTTAGFRMMVPAAATLERTRRDSRVLLIPLGEETSRPRAAVRVDLFKPEEDEADEIDAEYVKDYAEEFGKQPAFAGKFTLTDSGLVLREKMKFAGVGGTYPFGAARAYRLQWAHLAPDRQLMVTFDCPEGDLERYTDTVARMLLSFTPLAEKR